MTNLKKGIKTISLDEFCDLANKQGLNKFFTSKEISDYGKEKKLKSLAARYLIKKYIISNYKNHVDYKDIEILNKTNGKPIINTKFDDIKKNIMFSISHTRERATVLIVYKQLRN